MRGRTVSSLPVRLRAEAKARAAGRPEARRRRADRSADHPDSANSRLNASFSHLDGKRTAQLFAKPAPDPKKPGLDRGLAGPEMLGQLAVTPALGVFQEKHLRIPGRQPVEG